MKFSLITGILVLVITNINSQKEFVILKFKIN